jgi:2-desacetyl-2-hydroxyethyl bacteriochlorophyllide A dehydrogenase
LKVFQLAEPLKAHLSDLPAPKIESPKDVIVRINSISICGTDSEIYTGNIAVKKLPIVMGHEAGGVVEEIGSQVQGLEIGTKVLIDPNVIDGTCDFCLNGLTNLCPNGGLMGRDSDGVFAELIRLNAERLYPISKTVDGSIIPLIQPLSTVVRAIERLATREGDTVLVVGLGATGLLFSKLLKLRGATVIGARRTWLEHMVPISREFGVDNCIDLSRIDLISEVQRITNGRGPDTVVLAASAPNLIQTCLDLVRPSGEILQFFNYKANATYDAYKLYKKEVKLFATRSSVASDFLESIKLVTEGKIPLEKLITATYKFEESKEAFIANQDRKRNVKVIIRN